MFPGIHVMGVAWSDESNYVCELIWPNLMAKVPSKYNYRNRLNPRQELVRSNVVYNEALMWRFMGRIIVHELGLQLGMETLR